MEFEKEKDLNRKIGRNIKKYRRLYNQNVGNMTQIMLAKKVGVSYATIGSLESDNIVLGISAYKLYKISKALDTPIELFFK